MRSSQKTKIVAFVAAGFFILTGTYNSVVINSQSQISSADAKFVKRLDEIYGVTIAGREVAASVNWQKVTPQKIHAVEPVKKVYDSVRTSASASREVVEQSEALPTAAVQEELSLSLVEVVNPNKWQQGLPNNQFSGSLSTNNGVIEELSVSLPNGEGVSVSFSEMSGNVFEYDMNGDLYSGMMYQVDQNSYMVTLTNGPLEGTRLRFAGESPQIEQPVYQETVADVPEQNFEQDQIQAQEMSAEQMNQTDLMLQEQALTTQTM